MCENIGSFSVIISSPASCYSHYHTEILYCYIFNQVIYEKYKLDFGVKILSNQNQNLKHFLRQSTTKKFSAIQGKF